MTMTTIRMINVYDQKVTIIYSDDRDLLIRNLLQIFCIEEDDADERSPKDVAYITTPYKVEFGEELHGKLLKAITDIKHRAINKIIISSMFEDCEVQNTIIERK